MNLNSFCLLKLPFLVYLSAACVPMLSKFFNKLQQSSIFLNKADFARNLLIFSLSAVNAFSSSHLHSEQPKNNWFLVLNNPSDSGMFAIFGSVLGTLNFYERENFAGLKIDLNSGRYLDPQVGPNWWEYFFEPINLGDENAPKHYFSQEEYMRLALLAFPDTRERAFELIQRYIHLKPSIQQEVDSFCNRHFKDHFVIGVHHRGTDKITEWPLVPYEKTFNTLNEVISSLSETQRNNLRVYIATDEQRFLTYLLERLPSILIYSDFVRSHTSTALHEYDTGFYSSSYQLGKEALLDCLLLSRCHILLRPVTSCLSAISSCFNPEMPVIGLTTN